MAFLTRTEAEKNLYRFYVVTVTPTLFGEWSLVREYGRIGSPGTVQLTRFEREQEAQQAEHRSIRRRLQHGYSERAT